MSSRLKAKGNLRRVPTSSKTTGSLPVAAVITRLQSLRPSLGSAARRIADFIAKNASDVVHMSVTEVAERTSASEGSVVALCKILGATGFQQLKIALAQEIVKPVQFIHEDLEAGDSESTVIQKIFQSNIQTLTDTSSTLDATSLHRAVQMIKGAKRVEIYGIGSAAPIAEDAQYRMMRIGLDVKVVVDSHAQAISASHQTPAARGR